MNTNKELTAELTLFNEPDIVDILKCIESNPKDTGGPTKPEKI